jgi:two-component system, OmpR family, sensor histidine kinase CiaH
MATITARRLEGITKVARRVRRPPGMFREVGQKLVLVNVTVMLVILAFSGIFVYTIYDSQVYTDVDHRLAAQRDQAIANIQQGGAVYAALSNSSPYDTTSRTVIVDAQQGAVMWTTECQQVLQFQCPPGTMRITSTDAVNEVRRSGRDDLSTVTFDGEPQRVLTFLVAYSPMITGTPAIIQISRNVSGQEMSLQRLALLLAFTALLGAGLSGAGSLFLANRALVPIRKAFSRQRQFTADASHELRTPLALIRANAEMLSRHPESLKPDDADLVHDIIRETDRLNHLVSDLLTLARADSDIIQLTLKPVAVDSLVREVHEDLRLIAGAQDISCEATIEERATVQGDEARLRQLLLILLDNALKYTDPGGRVYVIVSRKDRWVRLGVSDTGIGIPAGDLPHIFRRFYRVDRARERETGGTGLGLSIARWIVRAHGGSIRVESEPNRGTRFIVDLPAVMSQPRTTS